MGITSMATWVGTYPVVIIVGLKYKIYLYENVECIGLDISQ